jgi:dipeptidyl aminopeptidase/acylaminoacyl peptidase
MMSSAWLARVLGAVVILAVIVTGCSSSSSEPNSREDSAAQTETDGLDALLDISSTVSGETPQWAPDGSGITFVSSRGGARGLWSVDPSGGEPQELATDIGTAGHFLARQYPTWSPNGQYIAYLSSPPEMDDQSQEIWLWSAEDRTSRQLTHLEGRINSFRWSPDGSHLAFADDRFGDYDIWTVRVSDGRATRLTSDSRYEVFPSWTPNGENLLYVRLNDAWTGHDVFEMPVDGGESRLVVSDTDFFDYRAGGTFGYPQVSPSGDQVLFRSYRSGWINYWLVPREGGEPRPVAQAEAEQSHARWSPSGDHILYVENHNGTTELRTVSAQGGDPQVLVRPAEGGMGVVSQPEWSPDGQSISYFYETPRRVRDLHVVDVGSGGTTQLTQSMSEEGIADQLVVPEKVSYESTDGYTIQAYLYKPDDAAAGDDRPGILWIHGGPTSQYMDTFEQHVQYFVQQGYVVLQPNIRGSSGYGKAFADANNGCWGHCDLDDVLAGKDYLGSLDYVDTTSTGITGTSYGGCMSMAAIAFAPGAFQASIPASGYGDWLHFMEEQEMRHLKLLEYEFGTVEENRDVYVENSPIFEIERVRTPTMLVHGEGYFPESEASALFAKELERHYKVHEHKTYPNENYYVYSRENRRQMLLDMNDFFSRFLRADFVDQTADPM